MLIFALRKGLSSSFRTRWRQRPRRRRSHQADDQQSEDRSPEGDLQAVDDGQDIGFTPHELPQHRRGARQRRLRGDAMLGNPADQATESLRHFRVLADRIGAVDDVGEGCILVAIEELIRSSGAGRRRDLRHRTQNGEQARRERPKRFVSCRRVPLRVRGHADGHSS